MQGTIIQVNTSPGGLPKRPVPSGLITPLGLEGDLHAHPYIHGGRFKAILLIAAETVDELTARGFPLFYGALGENLTTRGLPLQDLREGDQLRAGGAILEITRQRIPCRQLDVYGETLKSEIAGGWGPSGLYTSVVRPGPVAPGDIIALVTTLA
jgi:MOSC domain-containing protein YiiM